MLELVALTHSQYFGCSDTLVSGSVTQTILKWVTILAWLPLSQIHSSTTAWYGGETNMQNPYLSKPFLRRNTSAAALMRSVFFFKIWYDTSGVSLVIEAFIKIKLNVLLDTLILQMYILMMKINTFRGDISNIFDNFGFKSRCSWQYNKYACCNQWFCEPRYRLKHLENCIFAFVYNDAYRIKVSQACFIYFWTQNSQCVCLQKQIKSCLDTLIQKIFFR